MGSPSLPVRTSISGSWSASSASAARRAGPCSALLRRDRCLERRRREVVLFDAGGSTEAVADPDLDEPVHAPDLSGAHFVRAGPPTGLEDLDRRDLPGSALRQIEPLARTYGPVDHPDVRELLAACAALDLEDPACRRRIGPAVGGRQQGLDAAHQLGDAGPRAGRAGEHRMQVACPGLRHQGRLPLLGGAGSVLDVARQQGLIVLGQRGRLAVGERGVVAVLGRAEDRRSGPEIGDRTHQQDVRRQSCSDGRHHRGRIGAHPVDLVDEQQGRHAQPLQRAHQDPGLWLHALHGRDHQYGAVENGEHPLDLGDEVWVTGSVDHVDHGVARPEGDDGRLDRDPAATFQCQGVGLGGAGIDRSRRFDDSGEMQEPFGQCGLTGIDMGEDAEIQDAAGHA